MGNLLADCRRLSIDQCELCTEVQQLRSEQRAAGGTSRERQQPSLGAGATATATGPPEGNGHSPGGHAGRTGGNGQGGHAGRSGGNDFQPVDMSEADMLQQALRMSRLEAERARRGAAVQQPQQPGSVQGSEGNGMGGVQRGSLLSDEERDPGLMAAIAASYASGSNRASQYSEQQLVEQAIRRSKQEEENRQRARLRDEQAAEYAESLQVDRQREAERALRLKEEEEARRREAEEEERRKHEAEKLQLEAEEADRVKQQKVAKLMEEARSELRPEPPEGMPGRVQVLVRAPDGRRLKRAFLASDTISQIYHYTNVEATKVLDGRDFCLVSAMPRCVYEDRSVTLEAAGLQGQCALLIEIID